MEISEINQETVGKLKMTFSFPIELIESIEQVHLHFRHKVSLKNRHKLSKSKFCEIIIETVLHDHLEENLNLLDKIMMYWDKAETDT